MSLGRIYAHGVLVKDFELRSDKAGKSYVSLRIKTFERKRSGQGTGWTDGPPTFITVLVFGRPAENVVASVGKGDMVMVQGRLQEREYTKDDGSTESGYVVIAEDFGVSTLFTDAPTRRMRGESLPGPRTEGMPAWQGS